MLRFRWLWSAARNRFEQLEYIAADNPSAAVHIDAEIFQQVSFLQGHPIMRR